jgi:hypothetical protein
MPKKVEAPKPLRLHECGKAGLVGGELGSEGHHLVHAALTHCWPLGSGGMKVRLQLAVDPENTCY